MNTLDAGLAALCSPPRKGTSISGPATTNGCPYCPSLPSSEHAYSLIQGNASAIPGVIFTSLFRAALIAGGIYTLQKVTNTKSPHLLQDALAGAAAVELFVLGWITVRSKQHEQNVKP